MTTMATIALPDEIYQALAALANERHISPGSLLSALIAQEQWEEHAAHAYDAYAARTSDPREALTDEEFLRTLQHVSTATSRPTNADV